MNNILVMIDYEDNDVLIGVNAIINKLKDEGITKSSSDEDVESFVNDHNIEIYEFKPDVSILLKNGWYSNERLFPEWIGKFGRGQSPIPVLTTLKNSIEPVIN